MTASMPTHITAPDTTKVAEVTDAVDDQGLDPERVTFYVKIDGALHALLLDEIDGDGDVVFTVGERV